MPAGVEVVDRVVAGVGIPVGVGGVKTDESTYSSSTNSDTWNSTAAEPSFSSNALCDRNPPFLQLVDHNPEDFFDREIRTKATVAPIKLRSPTMNMMRPSTRKSGKLVDIAAPTAINMPPKERAIAAEVRRFRIIISFLLVALSY